MNKCKVEDCSRSGRIVKGMCMLHYERMYRSGDANKGRKYFSATDYLGKTYNQLEVVKYIGRRGANRIFLFHCSCGGFIENQLSNVKIGHTKSCGHIWDKAILESVSTRDNASKQPLWGIYSGMLQRCNNKKSPAYPYYGDRGIKVCEQWVQDYYCFESHMGARPSKYHSIDRINNDGDYEPGNVRWATQKEQYSQ